MNTQTTSSQSDIDPANLTESQKIYLPIAKASAARKTAFDNWQAAYNLYKSEPTAPHEAACVAAALAHQQAETALMNVQLEKKHNRGTVDVSNNSMTGALRDAGFGADGVL